MSDRARRYWESPRIVAAYARDGRLLPGERALLERVARDGLRPRVLDIGVGAGRTTRFLVPVASRYVGIDLSRRMIETCIARFGESPTVEFRVADARDLPFPDASFEVVLFSYCGIDDLTDPLDRRRAITEMARVATPGGWVALSAHNLNTVAYHFSARRRLAELSWRRPTRIPTSSAMRSRPLAASSSIPLPTGSPASRRRVYATPCTAGGSSRPGTPGLTLRSKS